MSDETEVRRVLATIDTAWRTRAFDGLDACFHDDAVIVGADGTVYAAGAARCAESYREFATNAQVLDYAEDPHRLKVWETTAVCAYGWRMTYRRDGEPVTESGSDEIVLQKTPRGWQVVWRCMRF
ncbi:MAG TPA: nuclear transport factor 2 family protein [Tahibacter sp.]|nr:nuclear transport factor 2 family protein [Tahibacter sp.]